MLERREGTWDGIECFYLVLVLSFNFNKKWTLDWNPWFTKNITRSDFVYTTKFQGGYRRGQNLVVS